MWKTLEDVPPEILDKYENGDYEFSAPPVCTAQWDKLAWINYIFGDK